MSKQTIIKKLVGFGCFPKTFRKILSKNKNKLTEEDAAYLDDTFKNCMKPCVDALDESTNKLIGIEHELKKHIRDEAERKDRENESLPNI